MTPQDLTDLAWQASDQALASGTPEDHLLAAQRHLETMGLIDDPIRHARFRRYAMAHAAAAMASQSMVLRVFLGWLGGLKCDCWSCYPTHIDGVKEKHRDNRDDTSKRL